nr:DNA-directed DNA polymerase [Tanacetum cinerariifolium]
MANLMDILSKFVSSNSASSSGSGTLPSNTITNPKEELKGITSQSDVAYQGPTIPNPSKVVKQGIEVTKDQVQTPSSQSTAPLQPSVAQSEIQTLIFELVVAPVSTPMPNLKYSIPYPSRRDNERRRDQANKQIEKFYEIFKDMSFEISFTDALILMPKFALADLGASINLMPLSVWEALSLSELTSTCMTLKLVYRSVSKPIGIAKDVSVKVGVFHFPADFVVVDFEPDPRVPLILRRCFLKTGRALIDVHKGELTLRIKNEAITYNLDQTKELKVCEAKTVKSSIDEPPEVKLKDLPHHLEYAFLEGDSKLPVIIAKKLEDEEKSALIKVLKSHKRAIAWKLSDIQGINLEFYTHKILMEEDYKPAVSLVHCVPKKGGFTIVENEENELILTRLVTGWRVCIDYQKLNEATHKDYFPLPFMDQMLERLAGNEYYCFLDGFFGYFQIPIDRRDQEKTTFTCPYRTFAYRRMPFGLCNVPGTFQRCEDTNLCLNWEKSHFMVKEGIFLGHKIFKNGIEVDRAKVDIIAKLPHPTTIKGAVLGQRHEKHFKPIHYASKTMTDAESNYTTTEKEMLALVYAFEKFRSYLIMNKSIVHTDHSALKYLFAKKDAKAILLRWVLLLQEFDFKVLDTKGAENLAADHLS